MHNIESNILCILSIEFHSQEVYNRDIMKEESPIWETPREEKTMPASKAQQKAVSKYVKANYDLYQVKMPKGKKELIKAHADAHGESVNGFINRAVDETMERDNAASGGV